MKTCSVEMCNAPHDAKGFCSAHYRRFKLYGDPLLARFKRAKDGETDAFIQRAIGCTDSKCLFWPYAHNGVGYGKIGRGGKFFLVHRLVCEAVHGKPSTENMEAAHECGNGHLGCVNPLHLSWKSRSENLQDMLRHGRGQTGSKQHMARLTDEIVKAVRQSNETTVVLAKRYGVCAATIGYARRGKTWKHI